MERAAALLALATLLFASPVMASRPSASSALPGPQMQVSVLRASPDTVWVVVTPPTYDYCGTPSGSICMIKTGLDPTITPCPMNRTCPSGTYTRRLYNLIPDTLAFVPGTHYAVGGTFTCWTYFTVGPGDCMPEFVDTYFFVPLDFYSGPTPALPQSWGRLKVRYR